MAQENMPKTSVGSGPTEGPPDDLHAEADTEKMQRTEHESISVYAAFVDLTKAFHTVTRNRLWKILVHNPGAPWLSPQLSHHLPPAP